MTIEEQLDNGIRHALNELNSTNEFKEIREIYKSYFSEIKAMIQKTSPRMATEDIIRINPEISHLYTGYFLLFVEINRGIKENKITVGQIK